MYVANRVPENQIPLDGQTHFVLNLRWQTAVILEMLKQG